MRLLWLSLVAGLIAWVLGHRSADDPVSLGLRISFALSATVGSAWWLRRELGPHRGEPKPTCQLRWQAREQRWLLLTPSATTTPLHQPGTLSVQLDLQRWMLLRFVATETPSSSAALWLPVSGHGVPPDHWHTLRCAVHAQPPVHPLV